MTFSAIEHPHATDADEVVGALDVDPSRGLTAAGAGDRLERFGPNRIGEERVTPWWRILLDQFADVLIWVLIAAAFVSGVVLGDLVDALVILAIVVLNAVIGFTQEYRAEDALAALREMSAPTAAVLRDGEAVEVDAEDVVPGDVLLLASGDRVVADARVTEAIRLSVDESALTGESVPVRKGTGAVGEDAAVGDRIGVVHAGTVVVAGRGRAVVVATGAGTEMGRIAAMLEEEEPPSPLQVELARIGRRIALLAGAAAVVVFGLGLARSGDLDALFLTAVALAVAAIPEGLPAVTTITLARGVRQMADRQAIVRRLPAVEALGAAQVVCTDKTGTLTKNEMHLQRLVLADRALVVGDLAAGADDERVRLAGTVSALCSDAHPSRDGFAGDPTETALVAGFAERVVDVAGIRDAHDRLDELSFDSNRKRMSTLHHWGEGYLLAMKGAPEVLLSLATHVATTDGEEPMDEERRDVLRSQATGLASDGLRTIALAYRRYDERPGDLDAAEHDVVYLGVAGMSDEVRPEAIPAVDEARRAGITVVMVTGDHEVTARAVASGLSMIDDRRVMGGAELRHLEEDDLVPQIEQIGAFARVDPADKVKIVRAWQRDGRIVAMTGDGVNDAPALRIADIGVAMGSGTDVSKDASDIVLADDNFATIVAAVERGRAIFANLKKVLYFLLSANISEIFTMLLGFLVFGAAGEPLLAVQLLWINLITDGLPALALGLDPAPPGIMRRPPETDRNLLGLSHQFRLVWQGAILSLAPIAMFAHGWWVRELGWPQVRTMAFTALVVVQLFHSIAVRAQTRSVWTTPLRNPTLLAAIVGSGVLQWMVVGTTTGNTLFETVPLAAGDWGIVIGASLVSFLLVDAVKVLVRRLAPGAGTAYD